MPRFAPHSLRFTPHAAPARVLLLLTLALLLALAAAACGGGDDDSPSPDDDGAVPTSATDTSDGDSDGDEDGTSTTDSTDTNDGATVGDSSRVDLAAPTNEPSREGESVAAADAAAAEALDVEAVAQSVVRVEATIATELGFEAIAHGTGSIVDPSGLILTNFHVIDPTIGHDTLVISITGALDRAPEQRFIAVAQIADPLLDLAVLRLVRTLDGEPVKPGDLDIEPLPLGDSGAIRVLDRVLAFGYPGIGDETLTVTAGSISGFLSQPGVTAQRAWFKTDTTISFGNSGGAAVDEQGRLIGVPTQINADLGGTIAHVRPLALALPLIERARAGDVDVPSGGITRGDRLIFNIAFGAALDADGALTGLTNRFPASAPEIFYAFDFEGMNDGVPWVDRWYLDGELIVDLSGARPDWRHGPVGTFISGIENSAGFPAGIYTLEIAVDGEVVAVRDVAVGDAALPGPRVTNVRFAAGVDDAGNPEGIAEAFPLGAGEIFAFFDFANAAGVSVVGARWYRNDELVFEMEPTPWNGGAEGFAWVSLFNTEGFAAGTFRVEILFDDAEVAVAETAVGAGTELLAEQPLALHETAAGSLREGEVVLYRLDPLPAPLAPGDGLLVRLTGGGDMDLYVKAGSAPSPGEIGQQWEEVDFQAPYLFGSDEMVFIPNPTAGPWWIAVAATLGVHTYGLTAEIAPAAAAGIVPLPSDAPVQRSLTEGDFETFLVWVPEGSTRLTVQMTGSGDADLYVRFGAAPGLDHLYTEWDGPEIYAPFLVGSDELVVIAAPRPGAWIVHVDGFDPISEVTVVAQVTP